MSQQGERPAAHEDDWWRRLYDENAPDTGTSSAADSLDDRFDSVSGAVGAGGREGADGETGTSPGGEPAPAKGEGAPSGGEGGPRRAVALPRPAGERAPWEPPATTLRAPGAFAAGPSRPRTFAAPPVPPEPPRVPEQQPPESAIPAVPPRPPLPRRPVAVRPAAERPAAPPVPVAPPAPVAPPVPAAPPVSDATAATAPAEGYETASAPRPVIGHVGDRPPTYDAEPTALPVTVPQELDGLVADTALDGARYGTYTLRAASVRGDSARFRGEPRRDALLTARFGTDEHALVLVAVATGARATESAHLAAADACRWIGAAVGRSHARLSEDIRAGRRGELKSGLHRLTDRTYGKLRARAAELGTEPQQYTAGLRCLLLPADPDCRTRIFFGVGDGALLRLREGVWHDLEPEAPAAGGPGADPGSGSGAGTGSPAGSTSSGSGPDGDRLTMDLAVTTPGSPCAEAPPVRSDPPAEPFRFRGSVARPGDTLLLCSPGLAEPLRGEPALARELAGRWAPGTAPGLVAFLADTQLRVKGYSDDRTGVGVWEA
ncbi:protein phosphatase 2C domain-containing protein [Streptomyces sp. JV185]|uniref:protein phosphatase 2C domain-containing protein n=1 Tax=Streptomyces sp. JV185 TaxID=858638 RepID=UPI002E7A0B9D|nr:protein phosphatase 2C domain-containing protein [Streptomyces sp. JV185]MEE1773021.1 protein phosphatase 2C domain-containing protein [Streptomyces sp. JV185]